MIRIEEFFVPFQAQRMVTIQRMGYHGADPNLSC